MAIGAVELNLNPTPRQLRVFSVAFLVFGIVVGVLVWLRTDAVRPALITWGALSATAILFMVAPPFGKVAYAVTAVVSFPIGWVLSSVIMAAIYYLVVTPIGLMLRLAGRDALGMRARGEPSSWTKRTVPREVSRYFKQY
jgi:hypothetical protein